MIENDPALNRKIKNFIRRRGQVTTTELSVRFSACEVIYVGAMIARNLLKVVGGGGNEPFIISLPDK
jgi:hypothetical protein